MHISPQVAFYLKHQAQIDEWSALRQRAPLEAHAFFASLQADIETLTLTLPDQSVRVANNLAGEYCKFNLFLPDWFDAHRGQLRIAIALEWQQGQAMFTDSYCGVWINEEHPAVRQLKTALEEPAFNNAVKREHCRRENYWWLARRQNIPTKTEYWDDLGGFRAELLARLKEHWTNFAPLIEHALVGPSTPPVTTTL